MNLVDYYVGVNDGRNSVTTPDPVGSSLTEVVAKTVITQVAVPLAVTAVKFFWHAITGTAKA